MKVLMVSKALVIGAYQKKCQELARLPQMALTVIVPPAWQEPGGRLLILERSHTAGYDLVVEPILFNGHFHLHFYPGLGRRIREIKPDILHIDEEPYNLATLHALWLGKRAGARCLFFTWQNLYRRYPPPWSWLERYVLENADYAIAGNREAVTVLRRKGYTGPIRVIPQFGVDPDLYRPAAQVHGPASRASPPSMDAANQRRPFTIGYVGRLVEEKGLLILLQALAQLEGDWHLAVTGSGPLRPQMDRLATALGIANRISYTAGVPSAQMPGVFQSLDCLVLPSLTRPNWKEQFGRVLIEAMSCQVPVIGSDSGEIPHLVDQAGLIAREGDAADLAAKIRLLRDNPDLRARLGALGRQRVLAHYTQARVAEDTYTVYRELIGE